MQKKSLSLVFIALTGCVALVPKGLLDTTSKSEATNRPTEAPSDMASAMPGQTPRPNVSPSQSAKSPSPASGSSSSPSAGVAVTPTPSASPRQTASPTVTPTPVPTPTRTLMPTPIPVPYAVSVVITPRSSTTIHLGYGNPHILPYTGINPTLVELDAVVTMSDTSTHSWVLWSTSDSSIARPYSEPYYAGNNSIIGVSDGVVNIIATSEDRKASSSISVTVQSGGIVDVIVE